MYDQKEVWSKLNYEVLPYHWNDRSKFYKDYQFLDGVVERLLSLLAEKLNTLHGENRSLRYWRIIIGPWLCCFVQILYDRFSSIRQVVDSEKANLTWLPSSELFEHVPKDFATFQEWSLDDGYNQLLYAKVIETVGGIPFEVKKESLHMRSSAIRIKEFVPRGLKKVAKSFLEFYAKFIPESFNEVVFVSSYLSSLDLVKLQLSLGLSPNPCSPRVEVRGSPPNPELRKIIELPMEQSKFERLLQKLIPEAMPTAYIEEYVNVCEASRAMFPCRPKLIFSTNALYGDEGFKFWAANQVERGVKLIVAQHGGMYGSALLSWSESHETKLADQYYTWGWDDPNQPKIIPMPSGQLAKVKKLIHSDPYGRILWLGKSLPRYSLHLSSAPMSSLFLDYIKDQERFLRAVSTEVQKLLLLRLFLHDFGWQEDLRLTDFDSSIRPYFGSKTMFEQLNESRLCVGTCNSTTDLETLSANFPTITFWNPEHWELRKSARSYFDDLLQVGICHKTPESAAAKVNEVYKDPLSWWMSTEVQDARKRFCNRFARTSENWILEWKKEFKKIIKE